MATSVNFSRFLAALAAGVILTLAGCGGGEEVAVQPTATEQAAARQAFTGPAVANLKALDLSQAKKQPLAVSATSESSHGFELVFSAEPLGQVAKKAQVLAAAPTGVTQEELLNWAEQAFPELFPSHQATQSITLDGDGDGQLETIAYRYWPQTNNYAGVQTAGKDVGGIYLYGTYVGNVLTRYAHINDRGIKCLVNVEVEGCRPKVVSVTPADGATQVAIQNVALTVNFDQRLQCPLAPVSGTFGTITGTLTCTNTATAGVVTIVAVSLPANSRITASLSGFRSADGIAPMVNHTWSFSTKQGVTTTVTKVLTVNLGGSESGAVSIIDPSSPQVAQVTLPKPPGYILPQKLYVDSVRDVAYVGMGAAFSLHRFNPRTGAALSPFRIEPEDVSLQHGHGVLGIAGTESEVCIGLGFWGRQSQYVWYNTFLCLNPDNGERVFKSDPGFLGNRSEIPTKLLYSGVHGRYYMLMAQENCLIGDPAAGGERDGYCQGSIGRAVEIDAKTKQKTGRSWSVGSMPLDGAIVGDKLYVLKSGDYGATIIDLTSGATQSVDWSNLFGNGAYPVDIQPDVGRGVYYVSDWLRSVRVMSFATNQQVGEILLPNAATPRGLTMTAGSLWVVSPYANVAPGTTQGSTRAHRIDPVTRTVTQSLEAGSGPWDIAVFERTEVQ